jgi:uncharacterized protein with GYD domain
MANPLRSHSGRRRKTLMPIYVVLMSWTDQGVRADRDTVGRREHADALAKKYGARIAHAYWTMGHYDIVSVIEAPDDESITAMMLEVTAEGNVRTETLRAFDHDQMQAIVQRTG